MKPIKLEANLPEIPLYFDDFVTKEAYQASLRRIALQLSTTPTANILETIESFLVELACPGFSRENFKVRIEDAVLYISLDLRRTNTVLPKEKMIHQEHAYQPFLRVFQLPFYKIDINNIHAWYHAGMLYIRLPKKPDSDNKISREIEVK